jgi:flagellar basal-body rod protein FlgB
MARFLHIPAIVPEPFAMISKLDQAFHFQTQVMNLRTERQSLIASNIANADTPHYKARDIDFGKTLDRAMAGRGGDSLPMARTAGGHLAGGGSATPSNLLYRTEQQSAVDGNTVDMDIERAQFTDNAIRYEASVNFVTSRFKGLLDAMQSPRS